MSLFGLHVLTAMPFVVPIRRPVGVKSTVHPLHTEPLDTMKG